MGKILRKINKRAKLKIYRKARENHLKRFICDIGKITEEEDRIICYVKQKPLNKYKGNEETYNIKLNGMDLITEGIKEITEEFKLNKPVYYVFDGIKFNTGLEITSIGANIIFRNCTFDKNIDICCGNEITFENNKYASNCQVSYLGDCYFTTGMVSKITFKNDKFINNGNLNEYNGLSFGMKIDAKLVEFINAEVAAESTSMIKIKAEKTRIDSSILKANKVFIDSKSIDCTDSSIIAQDVVIENVKHIFASTKGDSHAFYSERNLTSNINKVSKESKEELALKEARQELIKKLQSLSNYCQQINDDRLQKDREKYNNQTIVKTLKLR